MKRLLKNPLTLWSKWYLNSRKLLKKNRSKFLVIGYMSNFINVQFGRYNTFYDNILITNSVIDDFVYVSNRTIIKNTVVGKFCSIGADVKIGLGIHPTDFISTFPAFFSIKKQCQITFTDQDSIDELGSNKIGNDVWIGDNVMILSNVTIGDGCIIAAGAVVTKDVEPYAIVGGVPAKLIKKRFNKEHIQSLLDSQWWENDLEWFIKNKQSFAKIVSDKIEFERNV